MRLRVQRFEPIARYWLPALFTGLVAWLAFLSIGNTPLLRASGLAAAIVGFALILRRMGGLMCLTGGLALAFSPAFWAQTGGGGSDPATIVVALGAAATLTLVSVLVVNRPYVAAAAALVVFIAIFISGIGEPRSLRLTVFSAAWLLFLLTQAVVQANPRPDSTDAEPYRLRAAYRAGILLIMSAATLNDPLFVLFAPAVVLGLSRTGMRIPIWYWVMLLAVSALGLRGVIVTYINPTWWGVSLDTASAATGNIPYLVASGWRSGLRWVELFALLGRQFTLIGVALSIIGMARMARWYPTLGGVLMVAYAAFFAFGLAYFGRDRTTLLMPLLMIQVFWMSYAVHAIGQWVVKAFGTPERLTVRFVAPALYGVLPILLLTRVGGV